ncbi:MAG: ribosome-binding factor A [Actinobacteria bacterium RBG_16_64_13]|nr:MAG: ribosome-binding factor A [Actinobacteria bacterium RBG_16_64_13]
MGNAASYRMRRVNEALKEIIGNALSQDLKDPRIGFVTLTGVETAQDLSHAKVFVSVYGKQAEKDATLEGLRAARPYLQRLIGDELSIRRVPMLEFVYDATVDQGMRIHALLKSSGVEDLPPEDEPVDEAPGQPAGGPADASDPWDEE